MSLLIDQVPPEVVEEQVREAVSPAPRKIKLVRDYSRGSLRDHVFKAESDEELQEIVAYVNTHGKSMSEDSKKKLVKAVKQRHKHLKTRLILPASAFKLVTL